MASSQELIKTQLLLLQYRRGDQSAVTELVLLWEKPLFYYIRRLMPTEEDAWDTAQEVWMIVIRSLGKLRTPEAFPAWLYRIARNTAYRHLKKNPAHEPLNEKWESTPSGSMENDRKLETANADAIHYGLGKLKLEHREVLTLYFLEDFSLEEIATITDCPVGTVKSRMHYAKKELSHLLQKEDICHE